MRSQATAVLALAIIMLSIVVAGVKLVGPTFTGAASLNLIGVTGEVCNNNIDDDGDNLIDCADTPACDNKVCGAPFSCQSGTEVGDGNPYNRIERICQSGECKLATPPYCGGETNCADGKDNDENGKTDCEDASCQAKKAGEAEVCDAKDNNCNSEVDEGHDSDGDGAFDKTACASAYPQDKLDCNDQNATIKPGATEVCNGIDDNCDGQVNEGLLTPHYIDVDGDGFGNITTSKQLCSEVCYSSIGTGGGSTICYVDNKLDCNDFNATINPKAKEVCDKVDNNCDGKIDEGVTIALYADTDKDSYGDPNNKLEVCTKPVAGFVENSEDCNDKDSTIKPGATEICDNVDNNCDGKIDEDFDKDKDNYFDNSTVACVAVHKVSELDCDDANANINPKAIEVCIGNADDNCNGEINEGCPSTNQSLLGQIVSTPQVGNGVCEAGESSENAAVDCGCPEGKQLVGAQCEIVTPAADCGNDITESGEQCDGSDAASQCPVTGACKSDCSCAFLVGDGICNVDAGEARSISPQDCGFKFGGLTTMIAIFAAILGSVGGFTVYKIRVRARLRSVAELQGIGPSASGTTVDAYVNQTISMGYSPAQIKETLVNKGVDADDVDGSLESASKDLEDLQTATDKYGVSEPHDDVSKIEDYVSSTLKEGYDPVQIKTALTNAGWSEEDVEKVFAEHKEIQSDLKDLASKHGVNKPDQDNPEKIVKFAKESLNKGHTFEQVKKTLDDAGWEESAVNEQLLK